MACVNTLASKKKNGNKDCTLSLLSKVNSLTGSDIKLLFLIVNFFLRIFGNLIQPFPLNLEHLLQKSFSLQFLFTTERYD